jgi:hypothetical protein
MSEVYVPSTQNIAPRQPVAPVVKTPIAGSENKKAVIASIIVGIVLLGVGTGWLLSGGLKKTSSEGVPATSGTKSSKEAGSADESSFSVSEEGTLESGGLNGEGTHHLIRVGGESQTAYLTSSAVDLESFVGKKVKIWGEPGSTKKVGYLIDVGKIRVLE